MFLETQEKGSEKVEWFEHSIYFIPLLCQTVRYTIYYSLGFGLQKLSQNLLLEIKSVDIANRPDLT